MRERARFTDVLAVEWAKLARQPSALVMLGIIAGYALLLVFALSSVLRSPATTGNASASALLTPLRQDAVGFVADIVTSVSLIVLIVLAAQLIGQEFSRGTLRTLLVSRAGRVHVALAKMTLLAIVSLMLSALVALASVAGAAVFSAVTGEALLRIDASGAALLVLRTVAELYAWALIAFGATLLSRSVGVGIGASLGTLIAGDVLRSLLASLGTAGLWASRALPNTAINALTARAGVDASAWAWIVPNVLLWVVATNAWAAWRLRTLDVISATK